MFYFTAAGDSELWRSDGTSDGTMLLHTSVGNTRMLRATNDYLFFAASETTTGFELYRTDGSASETIMLKDIDPGPETGFQGAAGVIGNEFLFRGNDPEHAMELWRSNGTPGGTQLVEDISPEGDGHWAPYAGVFNSRYYFVGTTPEAGSEPWISDGTPEGTFLLKDAIPGPASPYNVQYAAATDDFLFFFIFTEEGPVELWKTQGTTASTEKVKTAWEWYPDESHYHSFLVHNNKFYFFQRLISEEEHAWMSDGTEEGTRIVLNYNTTDGGISYFEEVNGNLLFAGTFQGRPTGLERLVEGSRAVVHHLRSNWYGGEWDITTVGELAFFADHDQTYPDEGGNPEDPDDYFHLYQTDGVTAQSMRTLFGISTIGTSNVTDFNGTVIFTTQNDQQGSTDLTKRLWFYDPNQPPSAHFTLVNADTDEDIQPLNDGDIYQKQETQNISIRYTPLETVGSVVFAINDVRVRIETQPPYSLGGDVSGDYTPWRGAQPGTYKLTATPYSESGGRGTAGESLTINFTIEEDVPSECTASGTILREHWANVSGTTVPAIPVDEEPTSISQLTLFEGPSNIGNNYGARIRGYICPPVTGAYTFWIASNDHSELWLSTDDNPANRVRIANLTRATNPHEWTKFPSQRSASVNLVAGQRYYIEALHKEGIGSDHIAVGWQLPGGTMERPIPGSRLSPSDAGDNTNPVVSITNPNDGQTFTAPANITITADASDPDGAIAKVEFFEGSSLLFADHNAPYSFAWNNVTPGTYTLTARATDNGAATTTSEPITITVNDVDGCTASGTITWEFWDNVSGTSVSDIPVNTAPTSVTQLTELETPRNLGENYGSRIRGYICPPRSGRYSVYIASNDHSQLWLSTDDNPANKQLVAYVNRATNYREFKDHGAMPTPFLLEAGKRYYIEVLHKQGLGSDHLTVGWASPEAEIEIPIPGMRLSPYMSSEDVSARMASGAMDQLREQVSIYPNPASINVRELTIGGYEGIDETIETQVEIINMTGEVVLSEYVQCGGDCGSYLMKINRQLVPGLYMVNLKSKGVRISKRLLVE